MGYGDLGCYGQKYISTPCIDRMAEAGIEWVSLTNFDEVIAAAAENGYIAAEDIERLKAFRDDPSDESWIKK